MAFIGHCIFRTLTYIAYVLDKIKKHVMVMIYNENANSQTTELMEKITNSR